MKKQSLDTEMIEEGIIEEKIAENRKATEAYYAEQDKQK